MIKGRNTEGNTRSLYTLIQEIQDEIDYSFDNFVIINSRSDFPAGNPIQLENGKTYIVATHVDLEGDRIVCGENSVITGFSSENCSLTSTGLALPILTSIYSLQLRFITIKDVAIALDIDGGVGVVAMDWNGVNFENIPEIGTIQNFTNFIFNQGAFLDSQGLVFDGTCDTISISYSLLSSDGSAATIITVAETAVINRRFRITYSAIVANGTSIALDVDVNATIQAEAYILDTINFSGAGTYLQGMDDTFDESFFTSCRGIANTAVNGQVYMRDNAVATPIAIQGTYYKVLGTTTASADNSKVSVANNKLTIDAVLQRTYRVECTLSFNSSSNNVCAFGFYDSALGAIRQPSIQKATANTGGRAENVSFFCYAKREELDYFEVHCTNLTGANAITVTDMNFAISEK